MTLSFFHVPNMPKTLIAAVVFATATLTLGCASPASESECEAACENVKVIGMSEIDNKVKQDPELKEAGETGVDLVKKQAEALLSAIKEECMSDCGKKGTQKQAECFAAAKTNAELANCK